MGFFIDFLYRMVYNVTLIYTGNIQMSNVIYKVSIVATGGFYIGSTVDAIKRKSQHKNELLRNEHHCFKLQEDFNRHGLSSFRFEILLENVPLKNLRQIEYVFIQSEKNNPCCYNIMTSTEQPEASKEKISESLKIYYAEHGHPQLGKKRSPEAIAKSKASRGPYPKGEEHPNYGKHLSDEARQKISDAQRGKKRGPKKLTEEGRRKIKEAAAAGHYNNWEGKKHTQESKDKMSLPVQELTQNIFFSSLGNALEYYDMLMPTLTRALKTGNPILKGDKRGLQFIYIDRDLLAQQTGINPNLTGARFKPETPVDYVNCTVEGCDRPHKAKGLCLMHYKRMKKGKL